MHHHLDQPILSIKEIDLSPGRKESDANFVKSKNVHNLIPFSGSVFQVAVTPTLMSTTPEAISRFSPRERYVQ